MMKKAFAELFLFCEGILLLLVLGAFAYARSKPLETNLYGVYFGEDYPRSQSYEEYHSQVEEHLAALKLDLSEDGDCQYQKNSAVSTGSSGGLNRMLRNILQKIEKYTNANKILGKRQFLLLGKTIDRVTGLDVTASVTGGQNSIYDVRDVVGITEYGQLGWVQDDYDITEGLENLVDFGLRMKQEGRNFLLAENPNKYCDIPGFKDYSQEKYTQIADAMKSAGLDYLRFEDKFTSLKLTEKELFYDTDFHWKPMTGILTAGILADYMNANYGFTFDPAMYEEDSYSHEVIPEGFLGYLGKKATEVYAETDDFDILYPRYETDLTVYNSHDGSTKQGSMKETLYWEEKLSFDDIYDKNPYEFYGFSDQTLIRIHNNLVHDGRRVLIVKESYANCVSPFIAAGVEYLDIIDLRVFQGSLADYIRDSNPDTVIVFYGLSSYEDDSVEDSLYDFR